MSRRKLLVAITVLIVLVAVSMFATWHAQNRFTRSNVRAVLRSDAPVNEQLELLEPYVRIGDDISKVRSRLASRPNESKEIDRPTNWTLPLSDWTVPVNDTNLVLAITSDGKIVRIGRDFYGDDEDEVWLTGPEWQR